MNDFVTNYNKLFGPIQTHSTKGAVPVDQATHNKQFIEAHTATIDAVAQLATDFVQFVSAATAAIMALEERIKVLEQPAQVSDALAEQPDVPSIDLPLPDLPEEWDEVSTLDFERVVTEFVDNLGIEGIITASQHEYLWGLLEGTIAFDPTVIDEAINTSGTGVNLPGVLLDWVDGKNLEQTINVKCTDQYKVALVYVAFIVDVIGPEIFRDVTLKALFELATKG